MLVVGQGMNNLYETFPFDVLLFWFSLLTQHVSHTRHECEYCMKCAIQLNLTLTLKCLNLRRKMWKAASLLMFVQFANECWNNSLYLACSLLACRRLVSFHVAMRRMKTVHAQIAAGSREKVPSDRIYTNSLHLLIRLWSDGWNAYCCEYTAIKMKQGTKSTIFIYHPSYVFQQQDSQMIQFREK